jgi:glycosyltransferase involved in cell wall biosynthesis
MLIYFINPHQNHALSRTISNIVTFRHTASKMNFIFEAVMNSGKMGVLQTSCRFPEMSRFFPKAKIINKIDLKLWSINKIIKKTIDKKTIKTSSQEDYLFLTTKDAKYQDLFTIIGDFNGKIVLLLDDHLFSTCKLVNKIIEYFGSSRVKMFSVVPIKENPYFQKMPLSKVEEIVIGWPISQRFSAVNKYKDRDNKVLALGTLTYRLFDNDLMNMLIFERLNCVHPDREYLHHNAYNSLHIDSKIPVRDYRFNGEDIVGKLLRRIFNKYVTLRYHKIDMPKLMNKYRFIVYPPLFSHLPCLGMLEAMASGAILIGTNSYAYKCLGLIDGYNYISVGDSMDLNKINSIVESEPYNRGKYMDIQKNSLRFAEKYKDAESIKNTVMNGLGLL